jgi:PAS domain S-box-containing protein
MLNLKQFKNSELAERLASSLSALEDSKEKPELQLLTNNLQTHQIELEMQNRELRETQEKLEQSHNRYVDLYDFAPVGYLTLNNKGCILDINLAGASMLGVERSQILNQPLTQWLEPEYQLPLLSHLDLLRDHSTQAQVELGIKTQVGKAGIDIQLECLRVPEGEDNALCRSAMIDITERKQAEQRLGDAKEYAEQANLAKTQFLSRMSHELRTPLNAILGFAQILEASGKDGTLDDHADKIKMIIDAGWHLQRIIADLLSLSAIETNRVEIYLEDINLAEVIHETLELMSPLAKESDTTIYADPANCDDCYVRADRVRLKQVLSNLISNGLTYNQSHGELYISCEPATEGNVRIKVTDTGIGISEEALPTIFESFRHLHDRPLHIVGAGVGLSICKQLVTLMEGTIGVESKLGLGSTFWVELKAGYGRHGAIHDSPEQVEGTRDYLILYVEDSPSHVHLVQNIISGMGHIRLLSAHTPNLAIEMARAHRPDLILSDVCLPGMDGFELLSRLRADGRTSQIPVVAVSASAMTRDIERGLRAGFRRYLTKPLDIKEFQTAIKDMMTDQIFYPDFTDILNKYDNGRGSL